MDIKTDVKQTAQQDDFTLTSTSATAWTDTKKPRAIITIPGKGKISVPGDKIITGENIKVFASALNNLLDMDTKNLVVDVKHIHIMTTYILLYHNGKWVINHYKSKDIGNKDAAIILKNRYVAKNVLQTETIKNKEFVDVLIENNTHIFNDKKFQDHMFIIRVNHPSLNYTQFNTENPLFNSIIFVLAGIYNGSTFINKANPKFVEYEKMFKVIKPTKKFEPETKIGIDKIRDIEKFYNEVLEDKAFYGYAITFYNDYGIFGNNNYIIKTKTGRYVHASFINKANTMNIDLIKENMDNIIFTAIYNTIINANSFNYFIKHFCPYYSTVFKYVTSFIETVKRNAYAYNIEGKHNCIPNNTIRSMIVDFYRYAKRIYPANHMITKQQYDIELSTMLFYFNEKETFITLYNILSKQLVGLLARP
jgi:hypothetical protein